MKVVHICLSGPFNDDWGYQENLIPKYNVRDGHDVTVITSTQIDSTNKVGYDYVKPSRYFSKDKFEVIRIDFVKFIPKIINEKLRFYKSIFGLINEEKPDILFVHGFNFINIMEIRKYVKMNNVGLIFDTHASFDNSAKNLISKYIFHMGIWRFICKLTLPYINKVYAIAPGCKDFAVNMYGIPDNKLEYLFLGADTERIVNQDREKIKKDIRKKLDIADSDFVFITGGKLSKGKNIKKLVESFNNLTSDNIKLVIFGTFTDDHKDEMLKLLKNNRNIIYIGWLESSEVYNYLIASNVGIFPGTKSALWEQAICCSLPLICKKWKGMEYVDVGGNVIFIDDDDNLTEKIESLANNKELYNKMREIASNKGFNTFSYDKIARQALNIRTNKTL